MFKHILIPTDGSDLSNETARAGVALAQALGARVTGFFAAPAATPVVYAHFVPVGLMSPEEHARLIEQTAHHYLSIIEDAARDAGVPCKVLYETNDFPGDAIVHVAHEQGCDCIFMASHGRRRRRGPALGGETQQVACEARVPVVIYRVEVSG